MKVYIPTPLRSYTNRQGTVEAQGATLADVMRDLDRQFPGIRFRVINEQDRIREHIHIFVNQDRAPGLDVGVTASDKVQIVAALSGGQGSYKPQLSCL